MQMMARGAAESLGASLIKMNSDKQLNLNSSHHGMRDSSWHQVNRDPRLRTVPLVAEPDRG